MSPSRTSFFSFTLQFGAWCGLAFLVAPLLVVLAVSVGGGESVEFPPNGLSSQWYEKLFTDPSWFRPLARSIVFGVFASILSMTLGVFGAHSWLNLRSRFRIPLLVVYLLPILIPPIVIGVGQLMFYSHLGIADTAACVVLSHALLGFPFAFLITLMALRRKHLELETIACTLGAPRWYAFFRVTIPSMRSPLIAAGCLCFVISFDEPVVVLFITSHKARTLPRQVFDGLRYDLDPTVAAVAGLITLVWLTVIVVSSCWRRGTPVSEEDETS